MQPGARLMGVAREPLCGDSPAGVGFAPHFEDRKLWNLHGFSFCSVWASSLPLGNQSPGSAGCMLVINPHHLSDPLPQGVAEKGAGGEREYRHIYDTSTLEGFRSGPCPRKSVPFSSPFPPCLHCGTIYLSSPASPPSIRAKIALYRLVCRKLPRVNERCPL